MSFSRYIVYVDESGDHGLAKTNLDYPVFVLSFCIFDKDEYRTLIMPSITNLKFETFGHDIVVLHETDIRKRLGPFAQMNLEIRQAFMNKLTQTIDDARFRIIAVVIDKRLLCEQFLLPPNPYHIALKSGLECLYELLKEEGEHLRETHIIFESRGNKEDAELELEFRRICDGLNVYKKSMRFRITLASKQVNSTGLQFADMTARPIGLRYLRPHQGNRAADILANKIVRRIENEREVSGPIILPPSRQ